MAASPDHLVTYGTLMRASGMQSRLGLAADLGFVAACRFEGRLYDLGDFPGAVTGKGTVHGELYRLRDEDVLSHLDRYEGYDPNRIGESLFVRRSVSVQPMQTRAWVYWYNGLVDTATEIPSGSWHEHASASSM